MKTLRKSAVVLLFLIIIVMFLSTLNILDLSNLFGFSRSTTSILQVLKSESLFFLATDRITTYIYTDIDENSLLLGNREGLLIMKVTYIYGLDLDKLTEDSLEQSSNSIIVHLPDVEMLDMSPDLSTVDIYTKTSGLVWLYDQIVGYDMQEDLLNQFDSVATEFAYSEDLLPERSEILTRLNGFAPVLSEYAGKNILFE